ncbi:MAG TPA: DNA double-strand break repair nuclease NurA [Acidobacteriota bacterium]|nr:DNA double-strand break repair nuclease NurA [Acidobacteriota bacterium]
MFDSFASQITKATQQAIGKSGSFFESLQVKDVDSLPITNESFVHLTDRASTEPIVFVDGGSAPLFLSPTLCVGVIKVAKVSQSHLPRFKSEVKTATCGVIIQKTKKEYQVTYSFEAQPLPLPSLINNTDLLFSEFDAQSQMLAVLNHIRKLTELIFAQDEKSLVVLDGSLLHRSDPEKAILSRYTHPVAAVSKTCTLTTSSGYPITSFLMSQNQSGAWFVNAGESKEYYLLFAKLNSKSEYVFRVDMQKSVDIQSVLGALVSNSMDATFIGYPYGLTRADEAARITTEERLFIKTRITGALDPLTLRQLSMLENAANAHDILDSIKF